MRSTAAWSLVPLALAGCGPSLTQEPSLAPRAAEAIDPRIPVGEPVLVGPVAPALAARLAELVGDARSGDAAFVAAAIGAERLATAAGPPQSESWVVAQQMLSVAVAARAPTARALGDVDAIAADAIDRAGTIAPADFLAIQAAASEIAEIERNQAARLEALQARLGG